MEVAKIDNDVLNVLASLSKEDYEKIQKEAIKKKVIERLQLIINLLQKNKYEEIKKLLAFSNAGDDMGSDNYYINFSDINSSFEDIYDIINYLKQN